MSDSTGKRDSVILMRNSSIIQREYVRVFVRACTCARAHERACACVLEVGLADVRECERVCTCVRVRAFVRACVCACACVHASRQVKRWIVM